MLTIDSGMAVTVFLVRVLMDLVSMESEVFLILSSAEEQQRQPVRRLNEGPICSVMSP